MKQEKYTEGDVVKSIYGETNVFRVLDIQDNIVVAVNPKTNDTHELAISDLERFITSKDNDDKREK